MANITTVRKRPYASVPSRSLHEGAASTSAHTLMPAAPMKAAYAARPMRSNRLRPIVSPAAIVSARHGPGSLSR